MTPRKNTKASKRFRTKEKVPWLLLAIVVVGGGMLFLEVPYVTPPFQALTPVSCGIPQALKNIPRGSNRLICAWGNEVIFTGGLTRVYPVVRSCVDARHSLDLWLYKQPRAGETYILQAS
jgi:hypothetical protein